MEIVNFMVVMVTAEMLFLMTPELPLLILVLTKKPRIGLMAACATMMMVVCGFTVIIICITFGGETEKLADWLLPKMVWYSQTVI